jgi:hypothetical protein
VTRTNSNTDRWLAVGTSTDPDPYRAGVEAAALALTGREPRLLVVFCAGRRDAKAVLAGINDTSGAVPLIGCSSGGEIATDGPGGGTVVVTAFGGPGFTVSTSVAGGASTGQRAAGSAVGACSAEVADRPHQALMLLTDGMTLQQEEIIAGVYDVVGSSVPLVGAAASPDEGGPTFLLHGDEVLADGVVAAAIGSDAPFGIGVRHGFRKVGEPMIVTHSSAGRVHTLDDRPALIAYLDRLGAPAEAYTDPDAFTAFARTRPLGIRRRSGEEVRNITTNPLLTPDSLGSSGDIGEGAVVWVMEGDQDTLLGAADDACAAALDALDGRPALGLLAFDCVLRAWVLEDGTAPAEVARMAEKAAGSPLAGFYSYGEIARTRGVNGFHHQSLVVLAVG